MGAHCLPDMGNVSDGSIERDAKPAAMGAAHRDAGGSGTGPGGACGLVAAVIWGGYLTVSRQGIAAGMTAADLSFLRYGISGIVLLPWLLRHSPRHLAGMGWRRGVTLSVLAGPGFVLAGASGYLFAPLAHGAVIQLGMLTLMGIVLAAFLAGEIPGCRRIAGLVVMVAGLAITAGPGLLAGASDAWIGDVLFALAGSMWALFTVLQRRWSISPMAATAVVSVLSGVIFTPLYLAVVGLDHLHGIAVSMIAEQIIVQGLLSGVVALFAFARAVEKIGAGRAALFPALAPAVAILLGIPVTGEMPTLLQGLGLLVLTAGLVVSVLEKCPAIFASV